MNQVKPSHGPTASQPTAISPRLAPPKPTGVTIQWRRIGCIVTVLALVSVGPWTWHPPEAMGQESTATAPKTENETSPGIADPEDRKSALTRMLIEGNPFGLLIVGIILALSIASVYFIIVHATTITHSRLMPESVMSDLEEMLAEGEVNRAVAYCHEKENYSLVTEVILAGLQRYQSSEFGFAEYRSAVEEAGEDQIGRLYRKTEVLNVIGAIAPMLGLTGTVLGMIEAFNTIAAREGMARPEELAGGIGQALITTLLGLVVAIPTMVAFSFFRNKIDSIVSEAGKRVERIMSPLGRKKK